MAVEWIERLFYVRKCAACGEILEWRPRLGAFCTKCLEAWQYAKVQSCSQCFQAALECTCMPTFLSDSGARFLRKLVFYRSSHPGSVPNRLIYFNKRIRNERVLRFVAEELLSVWRDELKKTGEELSGERMLLVSLPRTWRERSRYGFDQSEALCRVLSRLCGIPFLPLIGRRWGGSRQKTLTRKQRLQNIKKKLYIKEKVARKANISLRDRTVILFDDLVTTGATMAAAVSLLHREGVREIMCLSVASSVGKK